MDSPTVVVQSEVRFLLVYTDEKLRPDDPSKPVLSMIPRSWFSKDLKMYLYPPTTEYVAGAGPELWELKTFSRNFRPKSTWIEYDVVTLALSKESTGLVLMFITVAKPITY